MSKGYNKVALLGGLTRDPELKQGENTSYLRFSLACGYSVNRNGQREEAVDYVPCVAFGKTAELIAQYCVKGTQLFCEGKVDISKYQKDGQNVWDTHVLVQEIRFTGGKRKDGGDPALSAPATSAGETEAPF